MPTMECTKNSTTRHSSKVAPRGHLSGASVAHWLRLEVGEAQSGRLVGGGRLSTRTVPETILEQWNRGGTVLEHDLEVGHHSTY
jgi:hypothetical protein